MQLKESITKTKQHIGYSHVPAFFYIQPTIDLSNAFHICNGWPYLTCGRER